ncbi:hypothetical protein [Pseudomonas sp. BBP2017]|uniref:hypothetical protein n=1 Tax=Pseudomonas sp. BBP2017 TaxID=2109731 RepID=UPI000D1379FB|nr:hypothetical protein [Pseudomonas sp. BBP2017]PSS57481.1 hypothetical protein C6382_08910 [Pseudomonas sp. BBP2017]
MSQLLVANASVVSGSLTAFLPTMSFEDQQDVILANLFAQRIARSERASGLNMDWLPNYKRRLQFLGWDATPAPDTYVPGPQPGPLAEEAVGHIAQLATQQMVIVGKQALHSLSENGEALECFEDNALSKEKDTAIYQLLLCTRAASYIDIVLYHQELKARNFAQRFLFANPENGVRVTANALERVRFNIRLFRQEWRNKVMISTARQNLKDVKEVAITRPGNL